MKDRTTLVLAALLLLLVTRLARAENGAADLAYCTNSCKLVKLVAQARDRGVPEEREVGEVMNLEAPASARDALVQTIDAAYSHPDVTPEAYSQEAFVECVEFRTQVRMRGERLNGDEESRPQRPLRGRSLSAMRARP